ncbi:MAG: bactofilin family protein [Ramlibacter sp.]
MDPHPVRIRRADCAAFVVALGCLLAGPGALAQAAAQDASDVYAAGGEVRTGGRVTGDFGAAGGKVVVDEPVAGDAWVAGGSVEVRAPVRDRLRVAGGDVTVDSPIGGKLLAAGGRVTVGPNALVGGGASLYGGHVTVEGRIDGDLHVSGRQVTINGDVRGDAKVRAERVELGPDARIGGRLQYTARDELAQAEGAQVAGTVVRQRERQADDEDAVIERRWDFPMPWRSGGMLSALSLLACAAVFLLLVPRYGAQAADRLRDGPLGALALGVVAVIAVPVVAVLLFITLLGIPLGLLLLAVYPVMLLAGFFVGVLAIARRVTAALRKPQPVGFAGSLGWFALALALVLLAGMVPALGGLAIVLLTLAGTGAAVMELQRRRKGEAAAGGQPERARAA